jgi:hypothetical protein
VRQREVLAQDAVLGAVGVGAAALVPHVDRVHGRVGPEVHVLGDDAVGVGIGVLLFLGREDAQVGRDRQDLQRRRLAVGTEAAAPGEAFAGGVREVQHDVGGLAQQGLEFGRDLHAGLDEALADLGHQQHAVAVEAAFAGRLVGEAELAGIGRVVRHHLVEQDLARALVFPAEQHAQARHAEGHAIVIGRQLDQLPLRGDEGMPVERGLQARQRGRADRLFEQAGLLELVQRFQVVVDAPGMVVHPHRHVGDLAELAQALGKRGSSLRMFSSTWARPLAIFPCKNLSLLFSASTPSMVTCSFSATILSNKYSSCGYSCCWTIWFIGTFGQGRDVAG